MDSSKARCNRSKAGIFVICTIGEFSLVYIEDQCWFIKANVYWFQNPIPSPILAPIFRWDGQSKKHLAIRYNPIIHANSGSKVGRLFTFLLKVAFFKAHYNFGEGIENL